jgi:apolipoprotein N-acyltransferase
VVVNVLVFLLIEKLCLPTRRRLFILGGVCVLPVLVSLGLLFFALPASADEREVLVLHPCMNRYGTGSMNVYRQAETYQNLIKQNITPQTSLVLLPETALQLKNWKHLAQKHLPTQNFRKFLQSYPQAQILTGIITSEYTPKHLEAQKEAGTNRYFKTYNNLILTLLICKLSNHAVSISCSFSTAQNTDKGFLQNDYFF